MKLLFLVCSEAKNIKWITQYFEDKKYATLALGMNSSMKNRTVKWRRSILFYNYIKLSVRSIQQSDKSDVIVSANFIVGAFTGFFCKIFGIKRTILSLNMISHEKGFFNKLVRKIIYNTAFNYPYFYVTVNSSELLEEYATEFNIQKKRFFLLYDCILSHYENATYIEGNGSVFCGGEAMRDWHAYFAAANSLPDVKFTAIARKINFDNNLVVPKNVDLHFDTDFDFFYNQLKQSSIVAVPLSTTAPAGLIVIIRAAMLSKPIIVTSTSSTRNYVENKHNGLLIEKGDAVALAAGISTLLADNELRKQLTATMHQTIEKFSLPNYSKTLENIILEIKNESK